MKKWFLFACLNLFLTVFISCGNNGSHSGKPDTVGNRFGSANDTSGAAQRTIDTGKAVSKDYSASGGTVRGGDTSKQKDSVQKRK